MQHLNVREAAHVTPDKRPALAKLVSRKPVHCKSRRLVKTSVLREPAFGEVASGTCLKACWNRKRDPLSYNVSLVLSTGKEKEIT